MLDRGPRVSGPELALLVALAAWATFPIVLLLVHASQTHTIFTGADGLIGADGVLGADQLQYLAWARDAGTHVLASDLFTFAPSGHVYLQPLFTITGLLWRVGLSLQLAYLVWKPLAVLALFLATVAWARRAFAGRLAARAATVTLALFLYTPLTALYSWTQMAGSSFRFSLYLLGDELLAAGKLWGYVPSAIGLAMVPVALLATERAVDPQAGQRSRGGPLLLATAAAAIASWLHPWQGITLIIIFVGLAAWRRLRGALLLAVPALGAAVPLGYYFLLRQSDAAWKLAATYEVIPRLPALVMLAGLGPLALIAAAGVRRPDGVVFEQALLLWVIGCFVTYFINDSFAPHALQGLSFPFAVLAVRGWRRLHIPAVLGVLAIALVTIPGLAYNTRKIVRVARSNNVQYYVPASDEQALLWLSAHAPAGGVLAPTPFAALVPSQTGRHVWVGHGYWSRDYVDRAKLVDRMFDHHLAPQRSQQLVRSTGASALISDCKHPIDLTARLGSLVASVHQFGCARVYVLTGRSASR